MNPTAFPLLPLVLSGTHRALQQILAQAGVPHLASENATRLGRFVLYDSAHGQPPALLPGQIPIDVSDLANCDSAVGNAWEALVDESSQRAVWQIGHLEVCEEVARFDKAALRQTLLTALRRRVQQAGGVWLCVSPYPYPYRSVFNFRLDHDQYIGADFTATLDALGGYEMASSHYLCGSAYEGQAEAVRRLQGLDVGSHGYFHHTYTQPSANLRNLRRGIETLQGLGLSPQGFVAPHGRFNRGLLAALVELGIDYSSEFGLVYDDLPARAAGSPVWQLPVHPVSLGVVLEAAERISRDPSWLGLAADVALEHYRQLIDARYRAGEPIMLYCHPDGRLGRYPHVLRGALDCADQCAALWKTTLTQWAQWWAVRATLNLRLYREAEQYVVVADGPPAPFRVGVEFHRGEHVATLPLDGPMLRFAPAALAYQNRRPARCFAPVRIDTAEGLRAGFKRWIDWERVTPIDEIETSDLRGWLKRTLRRIRP